MSPTPLRRLPLALFASIALVVSACQNSDSSGSSVAGDTSQPAATQPQVETTRAGTFETDESDVGGGQEASGEAPASAEDSQTDEKVIGPDGNPTWDVEPGEYVALVDLPDETMLVGLCRWFRLWPDANGQPGDFYTSRIWFDLDTGEIAGYHATMIAPVSMGCSPANTRESDSKSWTSDFAQLLAVTSDPSSYANTSATIAAPSDDTMAVYAIDIRSGGEWTQVVESAPLPDFGDRPNRPIDAFLESDDVLVWEEETANYTCNIYRGTWSGQMITREQVDSMIVESEVRCGSLESRYIPERPETPPIPDSPRFRFTLAGFQPAIAADGEGGFYIAGYAEEPTEYVWS